MKQKGVLFDLDGTLLDTSDGIIESVRHAIQVLGLSELSTQVLNSFVGPPVQESFKKCYGLSDVDSQKAADAFRCYYKERALYKAKLYPGILELLNFLQKKKILIGVATYKREDYAKTLLEHFKIARFCTSICGADNNNKLRKKDIIQNCLDKLSLANSEVILIGDTIHDARGAHELNIPFIGVCYGFGFGTCNEAIPYPCIQCVETVEELSKKILLEIE